MFVHASHTDLVAASYFGVLKALKRKAKFRFVCANGLM
jgi:hypothetical protein